MKNHLSKIIVIATAIVFMTGFGLGDIKIPLGGSSTDCSKSSDPKKCKNEENLKIGAKVVAIGIAAKLIHDMVIEFSSKQTSPEDKVVADYKAKNKDLPDEATVVEFSSTLKPGEIVAAGKEVRVISTVVVVPGKKTKSVEIKEAIDIFDNEVASKVIKSFSKDVNDESKHTGSFHNEFKFILPLGMPQGVYPVKTAVLLNGKEARPTNNKMQLVLQVDEHQHYELVALQQN